MISTIVYEGVVFIDHLGWVNIMGFFQGDFVNEGFIWALVCFCVLGVLTEEAGASNTTIDDFIDSSLEEWSFFSDTVMGGISQGSVEHINTSTFSGLRLKGKVSTENNGGFIQVRRDVDFSSLPSVEGIRFLAKGNGEEYRIHLRTRALLPWQYFSVSFKSTETWTEVHLPLSSFTRSSRWLSRKVKKDRITSIAIVAFGKAYDADLAIRELSTY